MMVNIQVDHITVILNLVSKTSKTDYLRILMINIL